MKLIIIISIIIIASLHRGARNDVESCRTIFILSCISKLLQKHILVHYAELQDRFEIMSPCQRCFIADRGTQCFFDNLAGFVQSSCENNQFTCTLFFEVSIAFDTINHKIFCYKLQKKLFSRIIPLVG